jgi:uncharacterized phage protein (TIGR02218 family)
MSGNRDGLLAHLAGGVTTVCRAWGVERKDGTRLGFTDHDKSLAFEGWTFRADTGMTAGAMMRTTGLAVDNVETVGALSDAAITEADVAAGRYDGAGVSCWLVDWTEPERRMVLFRGTLGEVTRAAGGFRADLRGLAETLNVPRGRVYQRPCSALLGDPGCGVDLGAPGLFAEVPVEHVEGGRRFRFTTLGAFEAGWFARGRLRVLSGEAAGLAGQVREDRSDGEGRTLELWQELRAGIAPGDTVRVEAGCDKSLATCSAKFGNVINFRGFPNIPGDDWITAYPQRSGTNDGGSYRPQTRDLT